MKNEDGIIRLGGVGTGRIFQYAHLRAYPKFLKTAWMVAFYDTDRARADAALEKYRNVLTEHAKERPDLSSLIDANIRELRVHDSLDSLLDQVDAIDICTHARGRMPSAIAAFRKGVSAMAEKPMCRTWSEADRAQRELAKAKDALFQLNDDNAFEPKYLLISDAIARGEIGKVQSVTLIRGSRTNSTTVLKAQATGLENGGGCLMDYGTHGLAGVMRILGPDYLPQKVEAVKIGVMYPHRVLEGDSFHMEVDDNARVKIMCEHKQTGSWATIYLEATWCGGHIGIGTEKPGGQAGGYLHIVGDQGEIFTTESERFVIRYNNGGELEVPCIAYSGESVSVESEMRAFWHALQNHEEPELTLGFGARIIAVCGAAYLSQIRGRAVGLTEFEDYSREFIKKHGDNEKADDAIVLDLLKPYRRKEA